MSKVSARGNPLTSLSSWILSIGYLCNWLVAAHCYDNYLNVKVESLVPMKY